MKVGGGDRRQKIGLEGSLGYVQGLMQIVGGRLSIEVWPQYVHDLFSVELVPGRKGEKLDEALGLPQSPLRVVQHAWAH